MAWRSRTEHCSEQILKTTIPHILVICIDAFNRNVRTCDGYALGKSIRVRSKRDEIVGAQRPVAPLYSEVIGPMNVFVIE